MDKRDVVPFDESFEQLRKKTNGAAFEFSLKHVLKSTATTKFPTFVQGTLPKQCESSVAMPVRKMKKVMGNAMWLKDFANNRERHNRMHGCQGALLGTQEGIDEVAIILGLQEDLTRQLKERKRKRKAPQTLTRRQTPLSGSQRSLRPSPRSLRVMPSPAKSVIMPKNVILNNDDIIIEDDDEDEREEKRNKRAKRVQQQQERQRRSRSRSTTPNKVRQRSFKDKDEDDGGESSEASSEDEESEIEESESEEDAGPALLPPRRVAFALVREIAAKERNDPRKKQQLPAKSVAAKTMTVKKTKRPRAARSLWFRDPVQDVKTESRDSRYTGENTPGSPARGTEDGDASGQDNDNSSSDSDGDEDYGFTTEEYPEERLLDGGDAVDDDNNHTLVSVVSVVAVPSPTSVLDVEEKVEVKTEITSWRQKQEPIVIDSSPEVTKQEPTRTKSSAANTQQAAATASPVVVPAKAKKKKKESRKRPSPVSRAKARSMTTTKRKPPRTLMDTRMEQAQAAIRALEQEEEQSRQDALSSVTERRSLANLRRVKEPTGAYMTRDNIVRYRR